MTFVEHSTRPQTFDSEGNKTSRPLTKSVATTQKTVKTRKSPAVIVAIVFMIMAFFWLAIAAMFSLTYITAYAGLLAATSILSGILSLRE